MSIPTLSDVFVIHEDDDCIADNTYCMGCGDGWEPGQKAVYVPAGFGPKNTVICEHLHCAVKNNEILLTGEMQV